MDDLPWDLNPDLTKERIIELGNFIANIRGEVIDLHNEELGDTRLSLGMRAYECCRSRIIEQAQIGNWPWLTILTPDKRFTFCVGVTPVRFVRNDPEELPSHKLVRSIEAERQLELFEEQSSKSSLIWLFVIDTYYKHPADTMYLVGYNQQGSIVCQWKIPLDETGRFLTEVSTGSPQAVELDKAPIKVRTKLGKIVSKDE